MSKHKKKTRKQKALADLHRKLQSLKAQNFVVSREEKNTKPQESSRINITNLPINIPVNTPSSRSSVNTYPFLLKDISKTGILTTAILTLQLILFFLLKNHIFKLPGIIY